jgi:putative phosphoesterase
MNIGVISDTHNFLDPQFAELFAGVSHILHAGDVGNASIIHELEAIAPVTAVYGNTDMNLPFKETEVIELAARKFLVRHIVNPFAPAERLKDRLARERPDVVIFGHTHRQFCETIGGIVFFNPGYAGRPKFNTERSAAILDCGGKAIRAEFLPL